MTRADRQIFADRFCKRDYGSTQAETRRLHEQLVNARCFHDGCMKDDISYIGGSQWACKVHYLHTPATGR